MPVTSLLFEKECQVTVVTPRFVLKWPPEPCVGLGEGGCLVGVRATLLGIGH